MFTDYCQKTFKLDTFTGESDPILLFTSLVKAILDETIPKSTPTLTPHKPWFTQECKDAIAFRKTCLKHFYQYPTTTNKVAYNRSRALARKVIKTAKANSWQHFVTTLHRNPSLKKAWATVNKISGKYRKHPLTHLEENGITITNPNEVAHTFGTISRKIPPLQTIQRPLGLSKLEKNQII